MTRARKQAIDVAVRAPKAARIEEGTLRGPEAEAIHGVEGLGAKGGLGADDRSAAFCEAGKEVENQVGEELVFAGLAGKDDDEGIAIAGEDGFQDGLGGVDLIGIEPHADKAEGKFIDGGDLEAELAAVSRGKLTQKQAAITTRRQPIRRAGLH